MSTYTGLNGEIRLYDSTADLRSLAGGDVEIYDATGPTFTDVTAAARSAASSLTGTFFGAVADFLYVGHTTPFARIQIDLDTVGVAAGALTLEYYDGSAWQTIATASVNDGTLVGANTMAQDGSIDFNPPEAWDVQGHASLDSDKYYVRLSAENVPSTLPNAEQVWPVDGQYFCLIYDQMNLVVPEGRARPEETMIHHRGRGHSSYSHYNAGEDTPVFEPLPISLSVLLDNTYNKDMLAKAWACGNPDYDANWDATGVSTKTDTQVINGDGTSVDTPAFADSSKKTICLQVLWTKGGVSIGKSCNEVYFSPEGQVITESGESVTVALSGLIYGPVDTIYWLAYRY